MYHSVVVELEKDHKLIYYDFRKELPEVSPTNPTAKETTPGPDALKSKQRIVANPDQKPGKQLVYIPEPRLKLQAEIQAPNLIAIQPQIQVPLPDRPTPKPFQAPEDPKTALPRITPLPSAPAVAANANSKDPELNALLNKPVGPPPKQFVAPAQKASPPSAVPAPLPNAPTVATAAADKNSAITALLDKPAGPPPKQFVPPTAKASAPSPAPVALPSAPSVTTSPSDNKNTAIASLLDRPAAGPLRSFTPPPAPSPGPSTPGSAAPVLPAAPAVAGSQPAAATVAIIGLNPANVPQIPKPEGSRPARIEAGTPLPGATRPELGGGNSGISMPGVAVQGPAATSPATATRVPLDRQSAQPATGLATPQAPKVLPTTPHVSVPQWPNTRHLPAAVEHHFQERVVYLTLIPSESSGDWIVWFAELTAAPPDPNLIVHPPTLLKSEALPPFPARMDHGTGSVRLTGIIRKDGHLNALTELAGGPADRELVEALETWQFTPARRNGVIIDADAVIEIPVVFGKLSLR